MKNIIVVSLAFLFAAPYSVNAGTDNAVAPHWNSAPDTSDATNDFYDNTETKELAVKKLEITGEIENPGPVDFSGLAKHSVIVKEAVLDENGKNRFIGAYRYDGYSLFDILNNRVLNKKNKQDFHPIIDLYVEVENEKGEKVVFSWGEIYYPNNLHKIIIATGVSRIVPSKTKDLWVLPEQSKLVAANDLVTERNISNPVKITVKSYPMSFKVEKGMSPMFSPSIKLFSGTDKAAELTDFPAGLNTNTFSTVFYGRGKGIHSTTPFTGVMLKDVLRSYYPFNRADLRSGLLCVTAKDGYRSAISYSELFNRNDQQEFLLVKTETDKDGGLFSLFPASDFFSDRAIKSITEIHFGD
ncbi:MAG: hypothetical protein NTX59_03980 [Elusimicrobia bacterium]|nr:hypothetical protein [Elusimicrobiota bacterium]